MLWPRSLIMFHFNPRSRKGSDETTIAFVGPRHISIHAPVKGATRGRQDSRHAQRISIHAPVKGATSRPVAWSQTTLFQSTLP